MVAPVSKLDKNNRVFGAVTLTGQSGSVHLDDIIISDEITRQLEQQLNIATPAGASSKPIVASDGIAVLVISDKEQKTLKRLFVGKREGGELVLYGQVNLSKTENPSGALQVLTEKGIKVNLCDGPASVPSEAGLRTLKSLVDSDQLVKSHFKVEDQVSSGLALSSPQTPIGVTVSGLGRSIT